MAKILYVETNFALGIAKGQDLEADHLLSSPPLPVQLVIPGLCFIEAFSAWNQEEKQLWKFIEQLAHQAREVNRNLISPRARVLFGHLVRSQTECESLLNDTGTRLRRVVDDLSRKAKIIDVHPEIVQQALATNFIDDQTDNLILWSVLCHAREDPRPIKAFLSSYHKDFEQPDVQIALDQVGVKYFRRTEAALGWLGSIADNPSE